MSKLPPRCARCAHFNRTGPMDNRGSAPGECRFDPPRFHVDNGEWGQWPKVLSGVGWCSQFTERRRAA